MAVAAVALGVLVLVAFALFLDSGADSGDTVLQDADTYAPGTLQFVSQRGFYLVRLASGEFIALVTLDAANRQSGGARCRVAPIALDAPDLPRLLDTYRLRVTPEAAGATVLFREDCRGAVYDVTGLRLDADGPNLERHPVRIRGDGRLSVNVRERQCSERRDGDPFAPTSCP